MEYYDWFLYTNNELIEKFNNIKLIDKKLSINRNMSFDLSNFVLTKKEKEYTIVLDFKNKMCNIQLHEQNVNTEFDINDVEIIDKDNIITIIYKLDEEENKIIIERKK